MACFMAPKRLSTYLANQRATAHSARTAALDELTTPVRRDELPPDPHERIADLTVTLRAMWTMLEERGATREDVHQRIAEIRASGEASTATRCHGCDSVVEPGRATCQICGVPK